jgi:hypothetical protein
MKLLTFVGVASVFWLIGCGPSVQERPKDQPDAHQKIAAIYDKIKIGDTRAQVEKLVGTPFMNQKTAQGDTAMYMSGMEGMTEMMHAQMRGAQASSLLGTATGLLGLAGPGGAIAGGIANEALSAGLSGAGSMAMPDPSDMEMLMVTYQEGRVSNVQRMNMGAMGNGMNPPGELELGE